MARVDARIDVLVVARVLIGGGDIRVGVEDGIGRGASCVGRVEGRAGDGVCARRAILQAHGHGVGGIFLRPRQMIREERIAVTAIGGLWKFVDRVGTAGQHPTVDDIAVKIIFKQHSERAVARLQFHERHGFVFKTIAEVALAKRVHKCAVACPSHGALQ